MTLIRRAEQRYREKSVGTAGLTTQTEPPAQEQQKEPEVTLSDFGRVVSDPRPDLEGDSDLWLFLLAEATGYTDRRLHDSLYALRKVGTVIDRQADGKLKFRPIVGPGGWQKESDYREVVNGWLVQHSARLTVMLAKASRLKRTLQQLS